MPHRAAHRRPRNPSILSNQSAERRRTHLSRDRRKGWVGGLTTSGARNGKGKKNGRGVKTKVEGTIWIDIADQHLVLFFFFSCRYRSLSGQSVVGTCRSPLAEAPSVFPTVALVTAAPRRFLFSSVSLTKTLLLSLPLLPTFPLFLHLPFPLPFLPTSPARR